MVTHLPLPWGAGRRPTKMGAAASPRKAAQAGAAGASSSFFSFSEMKEVGVLSDLVLPTAFVVLHHRMLSVEAVHPHCLCPMMSSG